ncbi:MAG: peptidase S41 [Bacteroidales bacterium]|nr:peptidase S41 [Bacteroidales bacterium]
MKHSLLTLLLLPALAWAEAPLWLRDAQISPDGTQIAFTYKGDVWKVAAAGGEAQRLTATDNYETSPIWSPDGKTIAFAGDRYGNFDIFVIPASGGAPKRLTYNSARELPEGFSADGKYVLFSASIQDPAASAMFPAAGMTELYQVPVAGGQTRQVLGTPALAVSFLPDGKMLYENKAGNENEWRKHHTSSVARDIWMYDPASGSHTNVTAHAGEDRNPVAVSDSEIYFLSERNGGSMNVYRASVADASAPQQVTTFKTHPVRFLSRADNGTLCFTYNGEIYTMAQGGKPAKVAISLVDPWVDDTRKISLSNPDEVALSPDGKSVAMVYRGDVFVTSVEHQTTKQITSTPEGEKQVAWGHDSNSLFYTSERDGKYNIYQAKMGRTEDPNFPNATLIEEKAIFKADSHERCQPQISPDGKKMAFLLDRRKIAVRDMESGKVTELTDGTWVDDYEGDVTFLWSPDSKWIVTCGCDRLHAPYYDIILLNATTGESANISQSGYFDAHPRWALDGNAILFFSDRYGMRNQASWGSQEDVMLAFLNQEAYDDFKLSKEDAELKKDAKKDEKKSDDKKSDDKDKDKKETPKDIVVELDGIQDRVVRLTPFSADLADAFINKDGDNLYFITQGSSDNMLWKLDLREGEVEMSKTINKGLKAFDYTPDYKTMLLSGKTINKFEPSGCKLTPVKYSASYRIDPAKEREYMYEYIVREEQARFYDTKMRGVDWKALTDNYRRFLPYINNNYDFAEMGSELLGELNVSHTGAGYRPSPTGESTASLGLLYDLTYSGDGMKVAEVVEKSPFDNATTRVKPGVLVEKINGIEITPENDITQLLLDQSGKKVLVSFRDPATGLLWDEVVKPITATKFSNLLYDRWVKARAADVDRWSNGRLGYVHIKSMSDDSFRPIYADILGKYNDRDGIVIDIRNNGGGRMHEDIEILFSGKKYLTQVLRGQDICDMPSRRWNKPSVMVTNPSCYSNAHGTPWVYQTMGLGKVVGSPVPGTMTSVNWVYLQDPTLYFGIPVIGYRTAEGHYLENFQLEPDVPVENNPADVVRGEDTQLRRAVETLLQTVNN